MHSIATLHNIQERIDLLVAQLRRGRTVDQLRREMRGARMRGDRPLILVLQHLLDAGESERQVLSSAVLDSHQRDRCGICLELLFSSENLVEFPGLCSPRVGRRRAGTVASGIRREPTFRGGRGYVSLCAGGLRLPDIVG